VQSALHYLQPFRCGSGVWQTDRQTEMLLAIAWPNEVC